MTEREDNVYKAKLAEQAERYDGKSPNLRLIHAGPILSKASYFQFGFLKSLCIFKNETHRDSWAKDVC